MKTLLVFLAFVIGVLAQNPAANIAINQTNVTGGISGDCLTVSSTKKLSQQVCTAGGVTLSGDVTGPSGSNTVVKLQGRAVANTGPSSGQLLGYNGSSWTPVSGGAVTAPGSDTQCIFNDGGVFGADAGCTYNKTTDSAVLGGSLGWGGSASLVPSSTGADILFPAGAAYIYVVGNGSTGTFFGFESAGAGLKGAAFLGMSTEADSASANAYLDVFNFGVNNPDATPVYKNPFSFSAYGGYQDNGTLTGTFELNNNILATNPLSYVSGGAFTLNTTNNYGLLTNFGSNQGFFNSRNFTDATCTHGDYCFAKLELESVVDATSKYAASDISLYLRNPNAGTPIFPGYSLGVECTYPNTSVPNNCRQFQYDYFNIDTISVYDFNSQVTSYYFPFQIQSDFFVTGGSYQPIIYGNTTAGGSLSLFSTNNASTTTDKIDLLVGDIGAPVTGLSIGHTGAATFANTAAVSAIRGKGGTPSVGTCGAIGTGSFNAAGFITSDVTGACVSVLTFSGVTATTGWSCAISNATTANIIRQTGSNGTTATFTGVTVTGDVLRYACTAY